MHIGDRVGELALVIFLLGRLAIILQLLFDGGEVPGRRLLDFALLTVLEGQIGRLGDKFRVLGHFALELFQADPQLLANLLKALLTLSLTLLLDRSDLLLHLIGSRLPVCQISMQVQIVS